MRKGRIRAVQFLVDNGANVNASTGTSGTTCLMMACELDKIKICKVLCTSPHVSINLLAKDAQGRTALHWAASCKSRETLE